MRVIYQRDRFIAQCSYDERELPKSAGFGWDRDQKRWYTHDVQVAAKLRDYASDLAKKKIDRIMIMRSPWLGRLPYPPARKPKDFQLEAAKFALSQNRAYIGADPGTGKTIMAALIANALGVPVVYVCPPFLSLNTQEEFKKWGTNWLDKISRITGGKFKELQVRPDLLIVPDSLLTRGTVINAIKEVAGYTHVSNKRASYHPGALLIVDEAHRFKTETSKRTQALKKIARHFPRQVFLSGTPMPNRPMELYSILSMAAPETIGFRNMFEYGRRYCAGYHDGFGWDFSGASNMVELKRNVVGPFMLRIKKADVLRELPPKTEEIVLIGDLPPNAIKLETEILRKHSPEDLVAGSVSSGHVATYRRELGSLKVEPSLDFIRSILDETEESALVFAFHKEVIADLKIALEKYKPLIITGETPNEERHKIVKTFQTDKGRRLFIGNYQAAGVGLTLTKATRVVHVEFGWVPAELEQASDRAHRIGQEQPVHVQYLVYANSLDRKVIETVLRKRKIIDQM